ncbi:unnamed protein product [Ectocarpus sp. 4 AP-2014]
MAPFSVMSQTDCKALVALYKATGGAWWKKNRNWNTRAALSQWHGVEINSQGRVVKLTLPGNNLRGPIPPELGELAALTVLSLSNNQLTGPIPPELGKLAALQRLILSGNELTGSPPQGARSSQQAAGAQP